MGNHIAKYSHKILKDRQLILEVLSGDFSINTLKMSRNMLYSDRLYNMNYDLLHDMREARMNFTREEHFDYLHYLGKELKVCTARKVAILTTESDLAKYETWFDAFNGEYEIKFKVFGTLSQSLNWLDRNIFESEIITEMEKLKNATCSQCFSEPNAFTGF